MAYFNQTLYAPLYAVPASPDDYGWCGYLLPDNTPYHEPKIELDQSFYDLDGSYLFASVPPDLSTQQLAETFAQKIWAIIAIVTGRTFIWLVNPSNPAPANSPLLGFEKREGGMEVKNALKAPLTSTLGLEIGSNMRLSLTDSILTIRNNVGGKISLTGSAAPITNIEDDAGVPFSGPGRGAVQFGIFMERQSTITRLGFGFQYYFPPQDGDPLKTSQYYALALPNDPNPTTMLGFRASLDITNVFNQYAFAGRNNSLRTAFAFTGRNQFSPFETTLPSYLSTDTGLQITLLPVPAAGMLVFSRKSRDGVVGEDAYLAPQGGFRLQVQDPPTTDTQNLLCGLAGTETIAFKPTTNTPGDVLSFHAYQPANAPRFPLPAVNLREPNSPSVNEILLDATFTTAWATMTGGSSTGSAATPIVYYSQPHGASLYANDGQAPTGKPQTLNFYQTKTADLGGDTNTDSFPLLPYTGVTGATQAFLSQFETQIVSPTRKQQILSVKSQAGYFRQSAALARDVPTKPTTTPQGLLATVATDAGARWKSVLLAHNVVKQKTYDLIFENLEPALQDAFQTNQQFLVVTQPKNSWNDGTGTTFKNLMSIEDWPFRLLVGQGNVPGDYRDVLIFKFIKGKLSEHIKNPSNWTSAPQFNATESQGLAFLSQWLQDYIDQARVTAEFERQHGSKESYFQNFLDIVDSDTWNGILGLKVHIDLGEFPPELQGLLAGIDLTRFYAHHFGVEVNFVQAQGGSVAISGNSSLFGLIYYTDAAYENQLALGGNPDRPVAASPGDYDFKVLTLKVLLENSAVKTFESKLQVTMNRWFDDQVVAVVDPTGASLNLPSNSIILDGAYEDHDGQSTFTFVSNAERLFRLNSNLLGAVEAVQAQFATLTDKGGSDGKLVRSRFTFTGYMNFMPAKDFDFFSFGSDWTNNQPGVQQGLYFSNLYLDLEFPIETPTVRAFTFDPNYIAFNVDRSRARPTSFFPNFPLKLVGVMRGGSDKGPIKLGFLPVSVEAPFTGLKGAWNGLQLQLDLGTVGQLAENAGMKGTFIGAWSPASGGTPNSYDVAIGLKLPGTGGGEAKLLSLQGILSLAVDDIQLLLGETQGTKDDPPRPAFMLKMTQIGLKFLGIKFPPSGNTVFFLFGDPNKDAPQNSLGWYAAYNKETKAALQSTPQSASLLAGAGGADTVHDERVS